MKVEPHTLESRLPIRRLLTDLEYADLMYAKHLRRVEERQREREREINRHLTEGLTGRAS